MAGFLPFPIASIGATPHAAPDAAATPHTGVEGAFAAVLGEMSGTDAAAQAHAGSAVQRLKLAFAGSGAMPATFDLGGFKVNVEGVRFIRSGDAPVTEMNIEEPAQPVRHAGAPMAERAGEARHQPVLPGLLPQEAEAEAEQAVQVKAEGETAAETPPPLTQPQPQPQPLTQHPKTTAERADAPEVAPEAADAVAQMALPVAALEQAAPKATAPAAGFGLVADAGVETGMETGADAAEVAAPVDAQADSRPLTATMTPEEAPEAAQAQNQTQPRMQASNAAASADDVVAATLAALAPAAGQVRAAHNPFANGMMMTAPLAEIAEAGVAMAPEARREVDNKAGLFAGVTADMPKQAGAAAEPMSRQSAAENAFGLADKFAPEAAGRAVTDAEQNTQAPRPAMTAEQAAGPQAQNNQQPAAQTTTAQTASGQAALPEGFQPLNAAQGYGAAPTAQPAAQPHGAEVVKVPTPQHLPEAMGLAISRHVSAEATAFTLRLDPAELGRVEVKLEMGKDGKATVSIQADNASTFDLLRRDSHALERALAEAGLKLDSGGLNFSLRQQDGQTPQQFAGDGGQRPAQGRMQEAALDAPEQNNAPAPSRRGGGAGLLDLSI